MSYSPGLFVTPGQSDDDPDTTVARGDQPISHFGIQVTATGDGRKRYTFKVWDAGTDSQPLTESIDSIERTAAYLEAAAQTRHRVRLRLLEFVKNSTHGLGEAIYEDDSWSILTKGRSIESTEILIGIDKTSPGGRTITAASGLESKMFPLTNKPLSDQSPNTNHVPMPTHIPDDTNPESPAPTKRRRRAWAPSLREAIQDGSYGMRAIQIARGERTHWSFDILDSQHRSICNNAIDSMAKLQTALTVSDETPVLARSMIRSFVNRSTTGSAIFLRENGAWTIYCLGANNEGVDNSMLSIGPNYTNGKVIDENDVPEHIGTALRSIPPAPQSTLPCFWDIETTQENTGNQHEMWVYTLEGMEGAGIIQFRGAAQLRSGLAEQAKLLSIDSRTINDGPSVHQCYAFGAKGKEGPGRAILTDAGWRLESPRIVDGKEGIWLAGPGCVRGEFFPSFEGTEGGPSH